MDMIFKNEAALIIPAGGRGSRMESSIPKQLIQYRGKPLIYYTLNVFYNLFPGLYTVIAMIPDYIESFQASLYEWGWDDHISLVEGGATRQDSVWAAMQAIPAEYRQIWIHDAVRPFITVDIIERITIALEKHSAVIPVIPVKDTIKMVEHDFVETTHPRARLVAVQTPQAFEIEMIRRAYRFIRDRGIQVTDDAEAVEKFGAPVFTVPGDERNIKITTPNDLDKLKALDYV